MTKLALRHDIVTRFTSLVAVDQTSTRPAGFDAERRSVSTPASVVAGDLTVFHDMHAALREPYAVSDESIDFARPPYEAGRVTATFCGT